MTSDWPSTAGRAGAALDIAARIGPYFAWQPWDGGAGWRPLVRLLDEAVVAERVDSGRRALAASAGVAAGRVEERAAASVVFLGLASRLLSPLLAAAAVGGALPVPEAARMWWRPVGSGPVPIAYRDLPAREAGDTADIAESLTRTAIRGLVEPLLEAFRRRYAVSPKVLWGNVSAAMGGAAGVIADTLPGHAERSAAIVDRVLAAPPLLGTADLIRPDPVRPRRFLVRHNCCLYYRIPGGGLCGDCVLTPEPVRRQQWRQVLGR